MVPCPGTIGCVGGASTASTSAACLRGEIDGDGGAAADRAGRDHGAARLMGEAVDLRQAETGALAERLGGEERLEDPGSTSGAIPTPVSVIASATKSPSS